MQYLLTQEEFDALMPKSEAEKAIRSFSATATMKTICTTAGYEDSDGPTLICSKTPTKNQVENHPDNANIRR